MGSACHEGGDAVSGVLAAMGVEPARARGPVRLSLGVAQGERQIAHAAEILIGAWRLQGASVRL